MDDDLQLEVMCMPLPANAWKLEGTELGGLVGWFERMITEATKENFRRDGFLAPTLNVLGFDPQDRTQVVHYSVLLQALMGDEEGKDLLSVVMPQILSGLRAFSVVLSTEAWTLTMPDVSEEEIMAERARHGGLAHHPDATEVVTLTMETRERQRALTFPILRKPDGALIGLGDNIAPARDALGIKGRFGQFLKPVPAPEGAN